MTVEIETLVNARYGRDAGGYAYLDVEVNGRPCQVFREKALRLDSEIAALGPYDDFTDFFVIIPPSEKHGIHVATKLDSYTNDRRYVALVRRFVDAVDNGRFQEGPVEIPG
ncbi:MAG: hypothetical protein H6662_15565 [Ardenticatenaceae bacterium]|nr:hypothetical protein [Anaerolineales bacterium]MCB8923005.1 hypothetical protein [Ardenticatenaceae bacterium]